MPGTIQDPRMNPSGERTFGTVFNHDDSHSYVFIKTDDDDPNTYTGSRFFTAGTRVELRDVRPAFLVVPRLNNQQLNQYQELDFNDNSNDLLSLILNYGQQLKEALVKCEIDGMVSVQDSWNGTPVIFDLIDIRKAIDTPVKQPIMDELNKKAKEKLKAGS